MSLLARTVSALREGLLARASIRAFSSAAQGTAGGAAEVPDWGAKNKLFKLLGGAQQPLSAAELWEKAQGEGLKSKRFMKLMLQQLKEAGYVSTQRIVGQKRVKAFGYLLASSKEQAGKAAGKAA